MSPSIASIRTSTTSLFDKTPSSYQWVAWARRWSQIFLSPSPTQDRQYRSKSLLHPQPPDTRSEPLSKLCCRLQIHCWLCTYFWSSELRCLLVFIQRVRLCRWVQFMMRRIHRVSSPLWQSYGQAHPGRHAANRHLFVMYGFSIIGPIEDHLSGGLMGQAILQRLIDMTYHVVNTIVKPKQYYSFAISVFQLDGAVPAILMVSSSPP